MYTQQTKLDSLCLFLYERPLHPELFQIYRQISGAGRTYESEVWITGCSHVISFYCRDISLCEAVVDRDYDLPETRKIVTIPFTREKSFRKHYPDDVSYTMNLQVETMSKRVYTEMHRDLSRLGNKRGNYVSFPQWRHNSLVPFTYISCEARPQRLHTMTFHAFPADRTITKVQTIFEAL
jgi:hypothetical protein